eukprot:10253129-Heterocapsa_arctica.AAC.1
MIAVNRVHRGTRSGRLPLGDRSSGVSWGRPRVLNSDPWDVVADLPGLPAAGAAGGEQALPE